MLENTSEDAATAKPPVVELTDISKWFPDPTNEGERLVSVQNVNLTISDEEKGEFVVVLGPSGCGKSTIMNMIAGMMVPDAGEVRTFGKPVTGPNPLSVTVPQAYTCFPWLSVLGNVQFGLSLQGKSPREQREIATEYLNKVGLGDRLDAYPQALSGGMKQRVAIARALAMKLPILLMDEPFGALDAQTRTEMQQMLTQLWEQERNSVIFITHDISEALLLADRIVMLSPRPAQIIHDMCVPFARPRTASLVYEEAFVNLNRDLLQLLKKSPTSGQVRVSV
ncbi:MAG: ABC transporter ATP-binding protein [Armatimonadota bacterium]